MLLWRHRLELLYYLQPKIPEAGCSTLPHVVSALELAICCRGIAAVTYPWKALVDDVLQIRDDQLSLCVVPVVQEEDRLLSFVERPSPPSTYEATLPITQQPQFSRHSNHSGTSTFFQRESPLLLTTSHKLPNPRHFRPNGDDSYGPRLGVLPPFRKSDYFLGSTPVDVDELAFWKRKDAQWPT